MQFRALGPLEVRADDGSQVEIGAPRLRALLTLLMAEPGRVVAADRIVDSLWREAPPATATGTLQTCVSQLRRLLEPGSDARTASLLVTRAPGYCLLADDVDLRSRGGRDVERLAHHGFAAVPVLGPEPPRRWATAAAAAARDRLPHRGGRPHPAGAVAARPRRRPRRAARPARRARGRPAVRGSSAGRAGDGRRGPGPRPAGGRP